MIPLAIRRQIQRYGRWLLAIVALMAIATVAGSYILVKQRLRVPWQDRYTLRAELETVNGLQPGLGQAVNVAGVRVGTVMDTTLRDGRATIEMQIDPGELPRVYDNAFVTLIPNTPLKDMLVELVPGRPPGKPLKEGAMIPSARTTPPIDSDELTAALDADTRDFFELLVAGAGQGTRGRGEDLRALFKALGPTAEQIRRLTAALAGRRRELKRLTHNLAVLGEATGRRDRELAGLVEKADATVGALASQEAALRSSLRKLPSTLSAARSSLDTATDFAGELAPTLTGLQRTVRKLPATLRAVRPLVKEGEAVVREQVRPLLREAQPLARDLAPTARNLAAVGPDVRTVVPILTSTVNQLIYNPPGDNEGFLYWLAWFAHNANSTVSSQDAHGSVVRGLAVFSCEGALTYQSDPLLSQLMSAITGPLPTC